MTDYEKLHKTLNSLKRHTFPYDLHGLPPNGIYILFEMGENYLDCDRIVRIGSHTGIDRLHDRINEHFIACNHRDSVFRKHLGRCFLTVDKRKDYIPIWNLRIKSRIDKAKNFSKINWKLEEVYEKKVTDYIRLMFSFAIIPNLDNLRQRCRLEKGLIATLAQSPDKTSTANWFGIHHSVIGK